MKRTFVIVWILAAVSMHGEILDRMRAVVNSHIVTQSDLKRERSIRAVLGEKDLKDDKLLLQDLIDAQIIDEQVSEFPGIDVADGDVLARLDKISDLHGIPATTVRTAIQRRLRMSEFFDLRFRQFLSASDDEVLKYYQTVFVPEAQKRGLTAVPAMDAVAGQIRSNLIEGKMTNRFLRFSSSLRRSSLLQSPVCSFSSILRVLKHVPATSPFAKSRT
jgi:hypothetical protein